MTQAHVHVQGIDMFHKEETHLQNQHQSTSSDNVSSLLQSWGLPELRSKFRSHHIETRALHCLTEKDICELIPKIGHRAIFRCSLMEWRKQNKRRATSIRLSARVESKTQTTEETPNIPIPETVIKDEPTIHSDYESEEISENMQMQNDDVDEIEPEEEETSERPLSGPPDRKRFSVVVPTKKNSSNYHVNVSQILSSSYEGQQIIAYYEVNGSFDYSHRRRLVTLLINEVIRKNRWLVQDDFANITHDIVQLFPREDEATYYTARNGLKNPKGCLYNKFLNLTRKLRQEGVLQYRNNVHLMPERISTRHSGEIKCYTESI